MTVTQQRRDTDLCESTTAALHGIRTYFNVCTDHVQGLQPRIKTIQEQQNTTRSQQESVVPSWEAAEEAMSQALESMRHEQHNDSRSECQDGDERLEETQERLKALESKLWDLPRLMARTSRFQRELTPGTLLEGWLYVQPSPKFADRRVRRWFAIDSSCISYLTKTVRERQHTWKRVKVCDLKLCSCRDVQRADLRFCFELLTPSKPPMLLQARGSKECKRWIEGIRNAIQLTFASTQQETPGATQVGEPSHNVDDDGGHDDDLSADDGLAHGMTEPVPVKRFLDATAVCSDCGMERPDSAFDSMGAWVCDECRDIQIEKVQSYLLDLNIEELIPRSSNTSGAASGDHTSHESLSSLEIPPLADDGMGYRIDHSVEMIV